MDKEMAKSDLITQCIRDWVDELGGEIFKSDNLTLEDRMALTNDSREKLVQRIEELFRTNFGFRCIKITKFSMPNEYEIIDEWNQKDSAMKIPQRVIDYISENPGCYDFEGGAYFTEINYEKVLQIHAEKIGGNT